MTPENLFKFLKFKNKKINFSSPGVGCKEIKAVKRVMKTGLLASGPEVYNFEEEFSAFMCAKYSVAVNSGTSALHLSLLANEIGPGDEVVVPAFTFAATANAVAITGAKPVFSDIELTNYCIDPNHVESLISPRTRAIIPVHLYGHPANMDALRRLVQNKNIILIEDAAQAHGAELNGVKVGNLGEMGCFSFYPTKNMTSGEGGMVTTSSSHLAERIQKLRNQGMAKRYYNEIFGLNNRMTDIHAAIGRVQLSNLSNFNFLRQKNAFFYDSNLQDVIVPNVADNAVHVYHQYTIRVIGHERDRFASELAKKGIPTGVYYPVPVPRLAAFNQEIHMPNSDLMAKQCLSIPINPRLRPRNLEKIVEEVNRLARAGA